jgi:hypothetical protein
MPDYVFTYRAPKRYQPGSETTIDAWRGWFESMGDALVDRGKPVFERRTIGSDDASTDLGGYSIVTAASIQAAVTIAKSCPMLDAGGGVEVGELAELP